MLVSGAVLCRQNQKQKLPQPGVAVAQLPVRPSWSEAMVLPAVPMHGWTSMLGRGSAVTTACPFLGTAHLKPELLQSLVW